MFPCKSRRDGRGGCAPSCVYGATSKRGLSYFKRRTVPETFWRRYVRVSFTGTVRFADRSDSIRSSGFCCGASLASSVFNAVCLGLHSFGLPGSARSLWNSWGPPFLTSSLGILAGYGPNERPRTGATSLSTTSTSASPLYNPLGYLCLLLPAVFNFPPFSGKVWTSWLLSCTRFYGKCGMTQTHCGES